MPGLLQAFAFQLLTYALLADPELAGSDHQRHTKDPFEKKTKEDKKQLLFNHHRLYPPPP